MDVTFGRSVVLVEDHDAALDFYCGLLGFDVIHDSELSGYRYLHVGPNAQPNVGLWLMSPVDEAQRQAMGRQTGNGPFLVLYVSDLAALTDRLRQGSVEIWAEQEDPASKSVHLRDPFGNVLIAVELADS